MLLKTVFYLSLYLLGAGTGFCLKILIDENLNK